MRRLLVAATAFAPALAAAQQPATWTFSGTADAGFVSATGNTDGTTKNTPAAARAAAFKHLFKANTFVSQGVEYVPDLQADGGYRVNSETAAVAPLASRINVKVGYVVQYNSKPPAKFGTTDRVFTSGLQVSF